MTDGSSQGLFVVVAVVIFGIFVFISYLLFRDTMKPSLAKIYCDALSQTESKTGLGSGDSTCSGNNDNGDNTDTSNITPDNPFGDLDFGVFGTDENNINNKLVGFIAIASKTGVVTGQDIENSGDTSSGAVLISNLSNSGYTLTRTFKEDIGEAMYLPYIASKYGISKIEIDGLDAYNVPDDKKMNSVDSILKSSGNSSLAYGMYLGYKGFGGEWATKDNPISQKMVITDTRGKTFTITVNIKVQ